MHPLLAAGLANNHLERPGGRGQGAPRRCRGRRRAPAGPPPRVTSGRCCRPARPRPPPSRPGSGSRGRRRCCAAARRATASRSRCARVGRRADGASSPTPRTCARSSPPPPDVLRGGESSSVPRAVRGPELDPRCSTAPAHLRQRRLMLPPFHGERMRAHRDADRASSRRPRSRAGRAGEPFATHCRACRRSRST